ncbi:MULTISPECIES: Pr6Pr family membrane protein [unclassified Mucilaginibacter]|uniref:Pr6Pr family membrane protein n=1 Tax=unclassified Mucilaginibacter TaxID=2617802 RepID=UPI002AC94409|nr:MULTISPECIES: Pr6Pr family membrane protein [unclassified Mucilaginibacter]MEB0261429.1 Pr6Pr family membrane protein [Mucilaginibacter sp. 10I4]MEB0276985.1 Pr6Pr family membrane protein [Mucilaginibacter sp. 10B2]MEB0301492.1 Pr6Pr family membrane protein [Mucilaginibacter sp. 5C4]WPX25085.1 Pr6Pr family membrane protein [Mucilaginibacter sp. 5C4]
MNTQTVNSKAITTWSAILALLNWFAIGLQFYLSINAYMAKGRTLGGAVVEFFSFFTIESNILVAFGLTAVALGGFNKRFFSRASVLTAMAVYITIVCLVYNVVLRSGYSPQGWDRVVNELLHAICPPLFILFWLVYVPKQGITYKGALPWLWFPFFYMVYVLVRGAICWIYPYFFMNATNFGYPRVALNCLMLMVVFLAFDMLFVWLAKLMAKHRAA